MGGGANPSKRFYDFKKINKNKQIENCENCKYSKLNAFDYYECIKNNFLLENIDNTVCDYYEENETTKIKKQCNFRKVRY